MITTRLNFEFDDRVIDSHDISGEVGLIIDLENLIPTGYQLAQGEQSYYVIDPTLLEGVFVKLMDIDQKESHSKTSRKTMTRSQNDGKTNSQFNGTGKKAIKNKVHFLTKQEQEVARGTVKGQAGWKVHIQAPTGYKFTFHYWNFVIISANNYDQKVYVVPDQHDGPKTPRSINMGINFTNIVDFEGYFTTYSDQQIPVVNDQGNSRYLLANNYDFKVNKTGFLQGERYFQIAENAWIKADQMYQYKSINQRLKLSDRPNIHLCNCRGKITSREALEPNTKLYTDRMKMIDNIPYYRITESAWLDGRNVFGIEELQ